MKNKLKNLKYSALNITTFVFLLIFNILGYLFINLKPFIAFDNKIIIIVNGFASQHSTIIPVFITNFGDIFYILLFFLISIIILSFYKLYNDAILLTIILGSGTIAIDLIKQIFNRLRPANEYMMINVNGLSFPSGHSFISVCFYGTLSYFIFKYVKNKKIKYLLITLFISLILLIGFSRVYLGVHYLSDVLGGYSLGVFWICLCLSIFSYLQKQMKIQSN